MGCKVIAEIGTTHVGNMARAKKLISLASAAGADYAKFQKRNPIECVPKELQNKPHPNQKFSYGKTYLEHRNAIELSIEQHCELFEYCKQHEIKYATSVWDLTSAKEIIENLPDIDYIKIPSACNQNWNLISFLINNWQKPIHISTGMLIPEEVNNLIKYVHNRRGNLVIYPCTSEYPCSFEHLYLNEISRIKSNYHYEMGFSNHGYGIAADIAAYILGVEWIERHFIDDRTFLHSDAAASLEFSGLQKLCRDLKAVEKSLQCKKGLSDEEIIQKKKLSYQ